LEPVGNARIKVNHHEREASSAEMLLGGL